MKDSLLQYFLIILFFVDLLKMSVNTELKKWAPNLDHPPHQTTVHEDPQQIQILVETIKALPHFSTPCFQFQFSSGNSTDRICQTKHFSLCQ